MVAEASARGTPAPVADIPPSREVLEMIGGGRLFRPDTAERLAEEVIRHFTSDPVPVGHSEAQRWDVFGARIEALYLRLTAAAGPGPSV